MRMLYKNFIIISESFYPISNKKTKAYTSRCNDEY